MADLPIIRFTEEDLRRLEYFYFASGTESIILNYTDKLVLKLFKKDFGQTSLTADQIEAIRKTKQAKIRRLATKKLQNPIKIESIALSNNSLAGYVLTKAKGTNMHRALRLDRRSKIEILKRAKDVLLDFHNNGVIHGDIKGDNVFFTADSVSFLDLDNMQVDELKANFLNTYARAYLTKHGQIFDTTVDSYMFNLMTLELLDCIPFGTPLMQHLERLDSFPNYTSSALGEIIHDMQNPTPKSKEKYLIDYIKR